MYIIIKKKNSVCIEIRYTLLLQTHRLGCTRMLSLTDIWTNEIDDPFDNIKQIYNVRDVTKANLMYARVRHNR